MNVIFIENGSTCTELTFDVLYESDADIAGFQFNVDGAELISASGGAAGDAGFTVSSGGSTVLGFSFTGSSIPAGSGVLTTVTVSGGNACLSGLVLSGEGGTTLADAEVSDCFTLVYSDNSDVFGCTDDTADTIIQMQPQMMVHVRLQLQDALTQTLLIMILKQH